MLLTDRSPGLVSVIAALLAAHCVVDVLLNSDKVCYTGSGAADTGVKHTKHNQLWTDIDAADCDDQLACTEYVHDIVQNLLAAEVNGMLLGQAL